MKKIFLIGAAKAGTTKLADMLDCSPAICLSNPKESDYFSKRIYALHADLWYQSLCSGLIELDTLIRDNIYQLLRCRNGTKTNEQAVFKRI
jgi:hypothetical protein